MPKLPWRGMDGVLLEPPRRSICCPSPALAAGSQTRACPDHLFLVCVLSDFAAEIWSDARSHDAVCHHAAVLARRAIRLGHPVLIIERGPGLMLSYFTLPKLGAIAVITATTRTVGDEIIYFRAFRCCRQHHSAEF